MEAPAKFLHSLFAGTVTGFHLTSYNQDLFLGIPFAQPPLDELRFRNPQSLNTTFSGTVEATSYAPECVGYGVSLRARHGCLEAQEVSGRRHWISRVRGLSLSKRDQAYWIRRPVVAGRRVDSR